MMSGMRAAMCDKDPDTNASKTAEPEEELDERLVSEIEAILDTVSVTNGIVDDEGRPLPSPEEAEQLHAELQAISDNDPVTNRDGHDRLYDRESVTNDGPQARD